MAEAAAETAWIETLRTPLEHAATALRALTPARRLVVAGLSGVVAALAQAPFNIWPVLFLVLPVLVWLIDGTSAQRRPWIAAAQIGWAFGFGYFLLGLYWVGFAFLVDAEAHAWLLPFVAVLFPGGLALFIAASTSLARLAWTRDWRRIAALAASLSFFEWLRGHILTGFPWNLFGYAWTGSDAMIQSTSIFGIYGLSLLTIAIALTPAVLVDGDGKTRGPWWPAASALGLLLALFLFGLMRLPSGAAPVTAETVRIVQPDVPQTEKWKDELLIRNWRRLVDLTIKPGLDTRTYVIWPEAAPPLLMLERDDAMGVLADTLPDKVTLLSGVVRRERAEPRSRFFNAMAVIDGTGHVHQTYDKSHLVPFGEYLPFAPLLESLGITKITGGSGGYSEGPGVKTLPLPTGSSVGPLICYEVIFPSAVVEPGHRPKWLVNMTDDSWFGPWAGPNQHLGIARVRAVETGLPIIRAANTGISAIIDPFGRIVSSLPLNEEGIVDGALPEALNAPLYAQWGDILYAVILLLTATILFEPRRFAR